ncbi:MAG: polysaccharide deacetylase family protein [Candidatus Cloacimonetes bacterium]|nr:polysaccharide deacetylase family protein [Candidatus Cloacimonadota bacterium]
MAYKIYRHGNRKEKSIALTFDDGPHPLFTVSILKSLAEYNIKATFFITGKDAEEHSELVQKIIHEGHEIGNHSFSHKSMIFRSIIFIINEIEKTDKILKNLGVKGEIYFRPPYGRMDTIARMVLRKMRKKIILWDNGPKDFKCLSSEEVVDKVLKKLKPGSIIVLHDGGGVDRSITVKAVDMLIPEILKKGYKFQTVSELIS